ncbi:MAG TPA: hypothetical protein VFU15_03460, partial [Bacteroidia bacterium]|nr:hypothetical protein [Bacteroidia bacterium]
MFVIRHFTEVHIGRLVVQDPVTVLTNILLFLAGMWGFSRVRPLAFPGAKSWSMFFFMLGLASFTGIFVHGFAHYMTDSLLFEVWVIMGLVQNVGISFAQMATAQEYFPKYTGPILLFVIAQYLVLGFIFVYYRTYEASKAHVALGMAPVMLWNLYRYFKGEKKARFIFLGILVSSLGGAVHTLQ